MKKIIKNSVIEIWSKEDINNNSFACENCNVEIIQIESTINENNYIVEIVKNKLFENIKEENTCLHCGKNTPGYCEQCYQELIAENFKLKMEKNTLKTNIMNPGQVTYHLSNENNTLVEENHIPRID